MTYKLVLLRHGQSEWNEKNLFTGWVDVALTEKGRAEATRGGELMKERDILRLNGPHGSFYLREDTNKPCVLVAGGAGFAPIKAIVEHVIAEKTARPMTIYWGGRSRADLYLLQLAESWACEHANIQFIPVLSDAPQSDEWQGRTGFVHKAAMQDWPDLSGHQVYVCGSPAMVAAARRDFVGQCQLPESEFFADSFEFANDAVGERSPATTES